MFTDRTQFFINFWIGLSVIAAIGIVVILWGEYQSKRIKGLLDAIRTQGAEAGIFNFINGFGPQHKGDEATWSYEGYSFTWNQLSILRKTLHEAGVPLSTDNFKDICFIVRHYINQKEETFIKDSMKSQQKTFSTLTGADFENLLSMLYTAMGYSIMKTGKTVDQGCDLVVNMGQERVVIQAKCYNGSVGNAAVQQAVGALKFYNCTKAIVITNSNFTPEAEQLAKVNNVELINGTRLRELLLQYLKESWS